MYGFTTGGARTVSEIHTIVRTVASLVVFKTTILLIAFWINVRKDNPAISNIVNKLHALSTELPKWGVQPLIFVQKPSVLDIF